METIVFLHVKSSDASENKRTFFIHSHLVEACLMAEMPGSRVRVYDRLPQCKKIPFYEFLYIYH